MLSRDPGSEMTILTWIRVGVKIVWFRKQCYTGPDSHHSEPLDVDPYRSISISDPHLSDADPGLDPNPA